MIFFGSWQLMGCLPSDRKGTGSCAGWSGHAVLLVLVVSGRQGSSRAPSPTLAETGPLATGGLDALSSTRRCCSSLLYRGPVSLVTMRIHSAAGRGRMASCSPITADRRTRWTEQKDRFHQSAPENLCVSAEEIRGRMLRTSYSEPDADK